MLCPSVSNCRKKSSLVKRQRNDCSNGHHERRTRVARLFRESEANAKNILLTHLFPVSSWYTLLGERNQRKLTRPSVWRLRSRFVIDLHAILRFLAASWSFSFFSEDYASLMKADCWDTTTRATTPSAVQQQTRVEKRANIILKHIMGATNNNTVNKRCVCAGLGACLSLARVPSFLFSLFLSLLLCGQ